MGLRRFARWEVLLGIGLVVASFLLYGLHYVIFHDARHIFIYLLGDVAFLPLEILLVTVIIHRLLNHKEKKQILSKLNMVIGAFFSEVGTELMRELVQWDSSNENIIADISVQKEWTRKDFAQAKRAVHRYKAAFVFEASTVAGIRNFLKEKRRFLLGLLENPVLLEHKSFTNLLWAVFHVTEELSFRRDVVDLPEKDQEHLIGDIQRVHALLMLEWLDYMIHLQHNYQYLFSLAIRTNPLKKETNVEITA